MELIIEAIYDLLDEENRKGKGKVAIQSFLLIFSTEAYFSTKCFIVLNFW